ncbi:MAG: poly-gamma-glutamate synthase PgsB [Bauldia sp.]
MPPESVPIWGEHLTDARLFSVSLAVLLAALIWLATSAWRHRRNIRAIPVRIHVAGTRGKSTTTRLIAAGLRAAGRRVMAKTTGSEARIILPDGSEEAWPRRGPAAIAEQRQFFARAVRLGVDTVVVECMAIRPEFLWASERHLVRATTTVVTNTRADHYEDVGDREEAMADALAWVVPPEGRLVASREAVAALSVRVAERQAEIVEVDTAGLDPLAADRALAVAVCAAHGAAGPAVLSAMERSAPDPGLYFERPLAVDGKSLRFANAFACNDVDSFAQAWNAHRESPAVVLFNARHDRPLRTRHFLDYFAAQRPVPLVFVAGDRSAAAWAQRRAGGKTVRRLRARTPSAALAEVAAAAPAGATIWGVGNYHGLGAELIREVGRT